ncbi:unnamed protein product [Camellia sinensis]
MELDIQKFLHNSEQHQFEFQHFPTSYLRLAAHRVAQHYGLQTMVQDNVLDGLGTRIVVKKLAESRPMHMATHFPHTPVPTQLSFLFFYFFFLFFHLLKRKRDTT